MAWGCRGGVGVGGGGGLAADRRQCPSPPNPPFILEKNAKVANATLYVTYAAPDVKCLGIWVNVGWRQGPGLSHCTYKKRRMQGSGLCDNQQSHILHDLTTMISLDAGRHHSPKLKNNKRLNKHLCSQSQRALVDKRPDVSISAQTAQISERPDRKTQPTLDSSFENVHG